MLKINTFDLSEVLLYLTMWSLLYLIFCLWAPAHSFEWHCRVVTLVHAVTTSSLAIYVIFFVGPSPITDAGGPNSQLQAQIISISLGYFLFDMIWCFYFRTEGLVMLAHHGLCVTGLTWCLLCGFYGTEIVATLGGAEITNPLLQIRWFLRETGRHNSALAVVVDWVFMLSFGLMRIGLGSSLLYSYFQQDTDFWGRIGCVSIYLISWVFFINIINYAIRKYS